MPNILLNHNLLSNLATATGLVEMIARGRIPEEGWTVIPTIWEDGTFFIEYRHMNDQGIHRFFYKPHQNPDHIDYAVFTLDDFGGTLEGKLLYDAEMPLTEMIQIPKDWKKIIKEKVL
jgi:hypothetical protein